MTFPISNSPQLPERRTPDQGARDRTSPTNSAFEAPAPDVAALSAAAGVGLDSDPSKVAALRRQFEQGAYKVDSAAVVQKLLDLQFPPKG